MATKAEKIAKLEKEVKSMKDTLTKYQNLFNEDGFVDTEEQQQLDQLQALIVKIENKIAELNGTPESSENTKSNTNSSWNPEAFRNFMDELKTTLDEMEQRLGV